MCAPPRLRHASPREGAGPRPGTHRAEARPAAAIPPSARTGGQGVGAGQNRPQGRRGTLDSRPTPPPLPVTPTAPTFSYCVDWEGNVPHKALCPRPAPPATGAQRTATPFPAGHAEGCAGRAPGRGEGEGRAEHRSAAGPSRAPGQVSAGLPGQSRAGRFSAGGGAGQRNPTPAPRNQGSRWPPRGVCV